MSTIIPEQAISDMPDRTGQLLIGCLTVVAGLLLLVAQKGLSGDWPFFDDTFVVCAWYSTTIAVTLVIALMIRERIEAAPWLAGLLVFLVILVLAWHTSSAYVSGVNIPASAIFWPYGISLFIGLFILTPYLQVLRDGRFALTYARLYQLAWDNTLTLAAAAVFTVLGWAILSLWAGLFQVVGVRFFLVLFRTVEFIHVVTGLLIGFGLVQGRTQIGVIRSLLNVCLALARPLLLLTSAFTLLFLLTLVLTGVQPLWNTGIATTLLLCLILVTIALVNGVYQDGSGTVPYKKSLRYLVDATLLALPAFAFIAAFSVTLRVQQHGWSLDRFHAALITGFAILYSLGYAASVLKRGNWLAWISPINTGLALLLAAVVLASQSPVLDFRTLTVKDQLARVENGTILLADLDLPYFRFSLGKPGYEALLALKDKAEVKENPELSKQFQAVLESRTRYQAAALDTVQPVFSIEDLRILPKGSSLPDGLSDFIASMDDKERMRFLPAKDCEMEKRGCVLLAVDLVPGQPSEWIFINLNTIGKFCNTTVFGEKPEGWVVHGYMKTNWKCDERVVRNALEAGNVTVREPQLKDLDLGYTRLRFFPLGDK